MNKVAKRAAVIGAAALLLAVVAEVCLFRADPRFAYAAAVFGVAAAAAAVLFAVSAAGRIKWAAAVI